jgi:hypothetical protein
MSAMAQAEITMSHPPRGEAAPNIDGGIRQTLNLETLSGQAASF